MYATAEEFKFDFDMKRYGFASYFKVNIPPFGQQWARVAYIYDEITLASTGHFAGPRVWDDAIIPNWKLLETQSKIDVLNAVLKKEIIDYYMKIIDNYMEYVTMWLARCAQRHQPKIGVRTWGVKPNGALVSVTILGYVWEQVTEATCSNGCKGVPPNSKCSCGLYALFDEDEALLYSTIRPVVGLIKVWGKVLVHEKGLRAQYAQPLLLVFRSEDDLKEVEESGKYPDVFKISLLKAFEAYRAGFEPEELWPYLFEGGRNE